MLSFFSGQRRRAQLVFVFSEEIIDREEKRRAVMPRLLILSEKGDIRF